MLSQKTLEKTFLFPSSSAFLYHNPLFIPEKQKNKSGEQEQKAAEAAETERWMRKKEKSGNVPPGIDVFPIDRKKNDASFKGKSAVFRPLLLQIRGRNRPPTSFPGLTRQQAQGP